ncbi:unnamed protein product, partial [Iphiclides podalirius]
MQPGSIDGAISRAGSFHGPRGGSSAAPLRTGFGERSARTPLRGARTQPQSRLCATRRRDAQEAETERYKVITTVLSWGGRAACNLSPLTRRIHHGESAAQISRGHQTTARRPSRTRGIDTARPPPRGGRGSCPEYADKHPSTKCGTYYCNLTLCRVTAESLLWQLLYVENES